jgi:hypothetical protein
MSITFTPLSLSLSLSLSPSGIVHHLDLDSWRMFTSMSLQASSNSDKHPTTKKFTILLKQPNKIPANLQILLIPINRLLLLLLVVLTTENMDSATSPLLHLFSFTSQNLCTCSCDPLKPLAVPQNRDHSGVNAARL